MSRATTVKEISIPAIDIKRVTFKIIGDTPLIMHAWDEKTRRRMLEVMIGEPINKIRDFKDPVREFIYSMYWLEGAPVDNPTEEGFENAIKNGKAKFGFPSVGFKASAVSAGYRAIVTKDKVSMYGAFHIDGEFVKINGIPRMREDMVRVANGAPDIRYRGEFPDWSADITVKYNAGVVTEKQVANLFNLGGFACGVGEWRTEKGGSFGMYHVG